MKRLYFFLCVSLLASNICAFTTHSYNLALLQHQQQQLQLQQQQQQLLQQQQQQQQDPEQQQQQQQTNGMDLSENGNDYGSMSMSSAGGSTEDYDNQPQYSFAYNVHDALTGDEKQQEEQRNGDLVLGQYSVVDPDGIRRTVEYTADAVNGFNAVVSRQNVGGLRTSYATAAAGLGSSSSAASSSSRFNSFEAMQSQLEAQNMANAQALAQANLNNQQQRLLSDPKIQNQQANAHANAMSQIQQQTEMQAKIQAEASQRMQAQQLMEQFQQQYRQQQQQVQRSQQQLLRARAQSNSLNHSLQATVIAHPVLSRTNSLSLGQQSLYIPQQTSASATAQAQLLQPYLEANAYTTVFPSRNNKW